MGIEYQCGFGNHFESEAVVGALPRQQNSPQQVAFGLYTEQISGSPFTVPRHSQSRSWLYRIRPSVMHSPFVRCPEAGSAVCVTPNQLRWSPFALPTAPTDFVQGLHKVCGCGSPADRDGCAVHVYTCNSAMHNRAMQNSDGDLLIVPQLGDILLTTEFGKIAVSPGEITVVPRGVKFSVAVPHTGARGYVCEIYDGHFELPDLGAIGSNGLANPRHFMYPVAAYEDLDTDYEIINKFQGLLFTAHQAHSPFDVVAWQGNLAPYKYNLANFNTINTVSFDHPDPSIFTGKSPAHR